MSTLVYLSQTGKIPSYLQKRLFEPAGGLEVVSRSLADFEEEDSSLEEPWFFLDFEEKSSFEIALRFLRASDLYGLSPVLISESSQILPGIDASVAYHKQLEQKGMVIDQAVGNLPPLSQNLTPFQKRQSCFLRFLYTRGIQGLEPVPTPSSACGFSYQLVNLFFNRKQSPRQILEELSSGSLLKKSLVERVNLCPSCRVNKVSFREVCAGCSSPRVEREPVIHHYRCGNMAPEKDFVTRRGYSCPKCKLKLIDVGTDYEIGSEGNYCLVCKKLLSDEGIRVKGLCLHCGTDSELGELILLNIYSYRLSLYGIQVGIYGNFTSGVSDYEDNEKGNFSWISFQKVVRAELRRAQRYKRKSSVLKIGLHCADECRQCQRQDLWKIRQVMSEMVRSLTRTSDFVCQVSPDSLYVLLPETNPEQTHKFIKRLKKGSIPLGCRDCKVGKLEISETVLENLETFLA